MSLMLVAMVAVLSVALAAVVVKYEIFTDKTTLIDGDHIEIVPTHDFFQSPDSNDVCPVGYSKYSQNDHFIQDACVVTRPHPSAVDESIKDVGFSPCASFHEYTCGKWVHESPKAIHNRSFDVIRLYTQEYMEEMQKNIYENVWERDKIGIMYESCIHSHEETSVMDSAWILNMKNRIQNTTSLAELAFVMGEMESKGFVTLAHIDSEISLTNTQEMLLYVNQDGVLGSLSDSDHTQVLSALLKPVGLEAAASVVYTIEQSIENAYVGTFSTDIDDYIQSGEYSADLHTWTTFKAGSTFHWDEFMLGMSQNTPGLYAAITTRRLWLFKAGFFSSMGLHWTTTYTLADWQAYLIASMLFGVFWTTPNFFPDIHINIQGKAHMDVTTFEGSLAPQKSWGMHVELLPWMKGPTQQFRWLRNTESEVPDSFSDAEFHWNPYPLPSDSASSTYRNICNEITWMHMLEKFEEFYAKTRKIDIGMMRHYEAEAKAHAIQLIQSNTILTPDQSEKDLLEEKITNIIFRFGMPNRGVPAFFDTMILDDHSLLNNVNLISENRFIHNMGRWVSNLEGVDTDFSLPTTSVNAYYHPIYNEVSMLGGIFNEPFYSVEYNNASLVSNIVHILVHEMFHSVDEHRILFNQIGSYSPGWVSSATIIRLLNALTCLEIQYNAVTNQGVAHNGLQTRAENYCDHYGRKIAGLIFEDQIATWTVPAKLAARKEYFESYAQSWCSNVNGQQEQQWVAGSVHALPQFRVDRALENGQVWGDTYSCGVPWVPICPVIW
jgi:hypothetical protein